MLIVGAGIAGLLAANMLRHKSPVVLERQSSLPNNHSAVLRFRSGSVGDITGIEFKKVTVIKATLPWKNAVADALAYSDKNNGVLLSNRSIPAGVTTVERFIAPPDLVSCLAECADIRYGISDWHLDDRPRIHDWQHDDRPIISTIPMPALMQLLGYTPFIDPIADLTFPSISGVNVRAKVANCEAYVSLYVPNPFYPFSRVSLTGDELIAEVPFATEVDHELIYAAGGLVGISRDRLSDVSSKKQTYAKIQEIDDGARKRFISWATDNHNVYSLGRFATWRPSLLLDDLVQDIRLIERWMNGGQYAMRLHAQRRA